MTALERIKKYTKQLSNCPNGCQICGFNSVENDFLLKAFKVMRDIAIEMHKGKEGVCKPGLSIEGCVCSIFEDRMKD
jgi:hypothetical protein